MKTKPIVLSTDMAREILAGTRTAIPIIIKDANPMWLFESLSTNSDMLKVDSEGMEYPQPVKGLWATFESATGIEYPMVKAPYEEGDSLYVRESCFKDVNRYLYRANYIPDEVFYRNGREVTIPWESPLVMPKEAARLFLQVTKVDVRSIQAITNDKAVKRGINPYQNKDTFIANWNKIHGKPQLVTNKDGGQHYISHPWEGIQEERIYKGKPWLVQGNPWMWIIYFEHTKAPKA